jgi:hypothetical protein
VVYQIDTPGLEDQAVTNDKIESGTIEINRLDATLAGALVPIGGIIMWSGTADQIAGFPNWQLCDGSAISSGSLSGTNTPDLVGRFILGTDTYDTGEGRWEETITGDDTPTGGSKDAIVVTHNHGVSNDSHNHGVSNDSHNHGDTFQLNNVQSFGYRTLFGNSGQDNIDTANQNFSYSTPSLAGSVSANSTGIDIDNNSTGIDIDNEGSSGTNANLPPYYSLAYIMRIN